MRIGYLGVGDVRKDIVFNVDASLIETFSNLKISKQANYTSHKVHGFKEVPEMTGLSADTVTFDMVLSAYLGVSPTSEAHKLEEFMKNGTVVSLVLGTTYYGSWVVKSCPLDFNIVTNEGDAVQITVTVTLTEVGG